MIPLHMFLALAYKRGCSIRSYWGLAEALAESKKTACSWHFPWLLACCGTAARRQASRDPVY